MRLNRGRPNSRESYVGRALHRPFLCADRGGIAENCGNENHLAIMCDVDAILVQFCRFFGKLESNFCSNDKKI